ncbi:WbuC family cupin fold metalloprotein [Roseateles sp.]|uniref:WbuC family cupin fold metalloprotein n=1 Tax=Roseateles sp. TaxID=1971397 RepID=UPI002DF8F393|nr:WbuC family cupin fold metalloprotein [Roseateles sp.]
MKIIDRSMLTTLAQQAAAAPRLRKNHNLHPELGDPVQRLLNAVQPGSYVRPHRHAADRWELFLAVHGAFAVLTFDAAGQVLARYELRAGGSMLAVEIPGGMVHAVVALEADSVFFEAKPGPYTALADKDFATWAPAEGDAEAGSLEAWYHTAQIGDVWARP